MSSAQDKIRSVAERIASRLSQDAAGRQSQSRDDADDVRSELAALRAELTEIQQRLTHIESHVTHEMTRAVPRDHAEVDNAMRRPDRAASSMTITQLPVLSGTYVPAAHPSEERFDVSEAVAELVDYFEREKICTIEPGGKPCDQCGMCSSRGF